MFLRLAALPIVLLMLVLAGGVRATGTQDVTPMPGVPNPAQAHFDYKMKCQGCHQPDGVGDIANTPPLRGEVAGFLSVPGGREFLTRVPGVASTDLPDQRLAQVLNWTIQTFDGEDIPADFKPYSPEEIASLRHQPLRLERAAVRARLIEEMGRIPKDWSGQGSSPHEEDSFSRTRAIGRCDPGADAGRSRAGTVRRRRRCDSGSEFL